MIVMTFNEGEDYFWIRFLTTYRDDVVLTYDEAKELATKLEQAIQDYETKGQNEQG